ncbi:MAG: hypothetical protein M5U19_20370 [Microthrixaceae bacterium]|nr:hypothetical protein [Microthrixaceae bacterium]
MTVWWATVARRCGRSRLRFWWFPRMTIGGHTRSAGSRWCSRWWRWRASGRRCRTPRPRSQLRSLTPLAPWHLIKGTVPGPVGTAAVVVAVLGAAWVGSAGWGSALASMGAVGLIATAPLLNGFREVADRSALSVLVGLQSVVGLLLPRLVMSRAVHVASGLSIAVNALLVLVSIVILGLSPGRPRNRRCGETRPSSFSETRHRRRCRADRGRLDPTVGASAA